MRKFALINSKGERIDLQSRDKILLYDQTGLGYAQDAEYIRLRNDFFAVRKNIEQHRISCTLVFSGEDFYKKYYDFIKFCQHAPLVMEYVAADKFFINVELAEIRKTQGVSNMHMLCEAEFAATSLFYRVISGYAKPIETLNLPVYPYVYDDVYPEESIQSVSLVSDSTLESPVKITIHGSAVNPEWRHYVNGQLVEVGRYVGTINAGNTLVIDAVDMPYSIKEYDSAGRLVADRYGACDFSTNRFFHLQNGQNRVSVSHDGVNGVALKVEAKIEYASV